MKYYYYYYYCYLLLFHYLSFSQSVKGMWDPPTILSKHNTVGVCICLLPLTLTCLRGAPTASASGFWQTGNQTCLKTVGQHLEQLRMRWGHISDLLEPEDRIKQARAQIPCWLGGFQSRNKEIDQRWANCDTSCNLHQTLHNTRTTKKNTALKTDRNFLRRSRRPLGWLLWVWSARQLYTKNTRWRRNFPGRVHLRTKAQFEKFYFDCRKSNFHM